MQLFNSVFNSVLWWQICYNIYLLFRILTEKKSESEKTASSESKETSQPASQDQTSDTGSPGGVFTSPGMQSIMQQMTQNPQLVQEMFNAPYMQSMMEALAANPEVASQVIDFLLSLYNLGARCVYLFNPFLGFGIQGMG